MKVLHPLKTLALLFTAAILWTACQKELSGTADEKQQALRLSGVLPDDPELIRKVPVLISSGFAAENSLTERSRKDRDRDGIPDLTDACPSQKETVNGYQDADGCPDTVPTPTDSDGDGIPNTSDACPTQAENLNGYQDTDGCPDTVPDTDGDGIDDLRDACPTEPETLNGYEDTDGCPDTIIIIPPTTIPASFQLVTPPVGSQGNEGSCVPFAVAYAARSIEQYYSTNATSYSFELNVFSPEYVYNQTKFSECGTGTAIIPVLDLIKNQGVSSWQAMPYSDVNGCSLQPDASQILNASAYKISSYVAIPNADQVAIKTMIASKHPVIITIIADNGFVNAGPGFIWNSYSGSGALPHTLIISGYDDSKHAYKVMNSWGNTWGDAGFSWIDYDFVIPNSAYYTYAIQ